MRLPVATIMSVCYIFDTSPSNLRFFNLEKSVFPRYSLNEHQVLFIENYLTDVGSRGRLLLLKEKSERRQGKVYCPTT